MIIKKHRFYFTKINAIFSKIDEILKNKWQTRDEHETDFLKNTLQEIKEKRTIKTNNK